MRTFIVLAALLAAAAFSPLAADDGRFSLTIGSHGSLLISGPGGQPITDVPLQTVGRNVTMGTTTFQVSYGRDANGRLTAVLASSGQDSPALHFSAGGKSIDAEKAVVTLTFSPDLSGVLVDPGYVGTVEVDSHLLRTRSLADDLPMPAAMANASSDVVMPNLPPSGGTENTPPAPAPHAFSATDTATPDQPLSPAQGPEATVEETPPAPAPSGQNGGLPDGGSAKAVPGAVTKRDLQNALTPLASQLVPILSPQSNSATDTAAAPALLTPH